MQLAVVGAVRRSDEQKKSKSHSHERRNHRCGVHGAPLSATELQREMKKDSRIGAPEIPVDRGGLTPLCFSRVEASSNVVVHSRVSASSGRRTPKHPATENGFWVLSPISSCEGASLNR